MAKRISVYVDEGMARAFKAACRDKRRKASDLARLWLLDALRAEGYMPAEPKSTH